MSTFVSGDLGQPDNAPYRLVRGFLCGSVSVANVLASI